MNVSFPKYVTDNATLSVFRWPYLPVDTRGFSSFPIAVHRLLFVETEAQESLFCFTTFIASHAREKLGISSQDLGYLKGRSALLCFSRKRNNLVDKYNLHICLRVQNNIQVRNATIEVIIVIGMQLFVRYGHRSLLYFAFCALLSVAGDAFPHCFPDFKSSSKRTAITDAFLRIFPIYLFTAKAHEHWGEWAKKRRCTCTPIHYKIQVHANKIISASTNRNQVNASDKAKHIAKLRDSYTKR